MLDPFAEVVSRSRNWKGKRKGDSFKISKKKEKANSRQEKGRIKRMCKLAFYGKEIGHCIEEAKIKRPKMCF